MQKKDNHKKSSTSASVVKATIIIIVLAAMLVGFYFYVSHQMEVSKREEAAVVTKTQKLLLRDLDKNYPPSPKELIKYYSELSQCLYGETHSDDELKSIALQMQKLYDAELIANQNQDQYLANLKTEVASMKNAKYTISSFSTSASTDVAYSTMKEREWAKLYCKYNIRQGSKMLETNEEFLLRMDEDKHWKIYGWKLADKNYNEKLEGQ